MDYLSVKELAELKGCQPRYIQKLIKDGKLASKPQEHPQNHKTCYMIPITALPEELQLKYYQRKRAENGVMPEPDPWLGGAIMAALMTPQLTGVMSGMSGTSVSSALSGEIQ